MNRDQQRAMFAKNGNPKANWNGVNRFQGSHKNVYKISPKNFQKIKSMHLGDRRVQSITNHELPTHQALSMGKKEFSGHVIDTAKTQKWENEAKKNSATWSFKHADEDLKDPQEGNVVMDFRTTDDYSVDDTNENAVPLGSYDDFFRNLFNQSLSNIENYHEGEVKEEILEDTMNEIQEKTAPDRYLVKNDGEYYLVGDAE